MAPKIYLYAEILTHIRQLTLYASLETEKRDGTKVDVSTDKKVVSVTHDGETQRLYLPTGISGDASVSFPTERKTELSARVQIEDEHEWKCSISYEIEAPWMAPDLGATTAIRCCQCKSSILAAETRSQWKNLPSENWADLMDFWFCHKPHGEEGDDTEDAAATKGFSSRSKLAVAPGIGMTDLVSLVLHAEDCTNVKAAEMQKNPDTTILRCSNCLSILGTANQDEDLIRLHKSSVAVKVSSSSADYASFPSSIFTCAQILSLIEATALKKFIIHSTPSQENGSVEDQGKDQPLVLWIFNPDIYYSCSAYDGNGVLHSAGPAADIVSKSEDTSQTNSEQPMRTGEHEGSSSAALQQRADRSNPHNDDTSAIYGGSSAPQFVSGDIEFEVPVQNRTSAETTLPEILVDSFKDTETPLVTSKQPVAAAQFPVASPALIADQNKPDTQNNDHINLVHRAAKIFYKLLPSETSAKSFLDANSSTYEELYLSNVADLFQLRETLERSTSMLPASARSFQDWSVGLLDRYEKIPSGLGVMQENPLARGISARDGRVTRWDIGHGAEGLYA